MDSLLQAPLFVFLRRAALDRLPTLTAVMAGMIVFFWMRRASDGTRANAGVRAGVSAMATTGRREGAPRKITYATNGLLLGSEGRLRSQLNAAEVPAAMQLQQRSGSELYLICRVDNDEEQSSVAQALREAGIVGESASDADKAVALFCSSDIGLTSMVRQLEPDLHIDGNVDTLKTLQATPLAKKTRMVQVSPVRGDGLLPIVEHVKTVSAFITTVQ